MLRLYDDVNGKENICGMQSAASSLRNTEREWKRQNPDPIEGL